MILAFLREKIVRRLPRRSWWLIVPLLFLMLIYYPVGMLLVNRIDDNTDFKLEDGFPAQKSRSVAIAARLMDREISTHWVPNDPAFLPGAMLSRMPGFQKGIVAAVSRFGVELVDQLGRTRGSSQSDPDLERAAGLFKYSPTVWMFDFSMSWMPTASSEKQYRAAVAALDSYNNRLMTGNAVFERRADNLQETLLRIATDLGSASGAIANHIEHGSHSWFTMSSDGLYYDVKGRMYAYYLILRELKADYRQIIEERQMGPVWDQMLESLRFGGSLKPFFVINGSPNSQFVPNQLAMQGFILLRARTQLFEASTILQK